jgi:hypothetical protein
MRGERIEFSFVDGNGVTRQFSGTVRGNRMEGTTQTQGAAQVKWTAERGA